MSNKPKASPTNFESAMERLEAIVAQMESGKLPLEDLIVRYEEGMSLVKVCQERLASAEQKIEIIARNSAGKPMVKKFEPEAEAKIDPPSVRAGQASGLRRGEADQTSDQREKEQDEVRLF